MDEGYSVCLNEWALDKDIKNELGLLLIISSLCAEKGFCWATNEYLGELFNEPEPTISRKIKKLEAKGYLAIEYQKRGTEITSRTITINKNVNGPLTKTLTDHYQKCEPTVNKNVKENNINNNNININEKENIKRKSFPPTLEEIESYIKEKQLNVRAKDFLEYFEATNWIDSNGNKVKSWKGKLLTWNSYRKKETNTQTKITSNPFVEIMMEGKDDKGEYG